MTSASEASSTSTAATGPTTQQVVRAVAALARERGRDDIAAPLQGAAARCDRPSTIVCVVGEFKQGKSSLINALLGADLCPVDDDMATAAITLVHHGDRLAVTVRHRESDEVVATSVDPGSLRDWVTEEGNPENRKRVERVDIEAPGAFLAEGVAIVDTPGAGGVHAGYGAATLAFLPYADGLILASDASAELSAPEIAFLGAARERCPVVIHGLTKTDLHPEWRRIAELDREHLRRAGIDARTIPLSAPLRAAGLSTLDAELTRRSGYPELLGALRESVIAPARDNAASRAAAESLTTLDLLDAAAREELAVLADPARASDVVARVEQAEARLARLRGPGSRWSTLVADRVADLSNDVTFRFRGALREILRETDEAIETLKTPEDWDATAARLQDRVAAAVTDAIVAIDEGTVAIRGAVTELLAEEALDLPPVATGGAVDVRTLWRDRPMALGGSAVGRAVGTAMTGLRGAQSGILMFGMLSRFAPAGVAAVMMSNPVTIGLGAAFAGIQLLDAHRRRLSGLRQQAKAQVRQFVDDVQFEAGDAIGGAVREAQRGLRDDFTAAIDTMSRTYADMAAQARQAAAADAARSGERTAILRARLDRIDHARRLLGVVAA